MKKKRDDIAAWFERYAGSFILETAELQKNIELKKDHSFMVRNEIVYLAKKLAISEDETALAEIIALLHDVGRFEQFSTYRTFSDAHSADHAELGVRIINDNSLLRGFSGESENIVLKSILYHNRPCLPENEDESVLFFSKLLRDADKLDIWNVVLGYYSERDRIRNTTIELDLPDTHGVSPEVYGEIMNHQIVHFTHVKNLNDFKLLQAGWVFDVNFKPSFERIIEREYMPRLKSALPEDGAITAVFQEVEYYLEARSGSL